MAIPKWVVRLYPAVAPVGAPTAILYVAESCAPCSRVGRFFAVRRPVHMVVRAAEDHPNRDLTRVTYDPGDGGPEAEGVVALGHAAGHLNLLWAIVGHFARLPLLRAVIQWIVDRSGGGPRTIPRRGSLPSAQMDPPS